MNNKTPVRIEPAGAAVLSGAGSGVGVYDVCLRIAFLARGGERVLREAAASRQREAVALARQMSERTPEAKLLSDAESREAAARRALDAAEAGLAEAEDARDEILSSADPDLAALTAETARVAEFRPRVDSARDVLERLSSRTAAARKAAEAAAEKLVTPSIAQWQQQLQAEIDTELAAISAALGQERLARLLATVMALQGLSEGGQTSLQAAIKQAVGVTRVVQW